MVIDFIGSEMSEVFYASLAVTVEAADGHRSKVEQIDELMD
jgi:hypothetical protein